MIKGVYFKSESDLQSHFLLVHYVSSKEHNCRVTVYEIDCPEGDFKTGDVIESSEEEYFLEIDIWNKYYFPSFAEDMQWYHNFDGKEDRIQAVAEVMKYGLALGIKEGNIELY